MAIGRPGEVHYLRGSTTGAGVSRGGQAASGPKFFGKNDFIGYGEVSRVFEQGSSATFKRRSGRLGYGKRIITADYTTSQLSIGDQQPKAPAKGGAPQAEERRTGKRHIVAPWTDSVSGVFASSHLPGALSRQDKLHKLESCQLGSGVRALPPPGWEEMVSRRGKKYWYHTKSGISQWEDPDTDRQELVQSRRPLTAPPERRPQGTKPRNYRGAERNVELARHGGVCALQGVFKGGQTIMAGPFNPWRESRPARVAMRDVMGEGPRGKQA